MRSWRFATPAPMADTRRFDPRRHDADAGPRERTTVPIDQRPNGLPYFVVHAPDGRFARINEAADAARVAACTPGARIAAMTANGCVSRPDVTREVAREFRHAATGACPGRPELAWSGSRCGGRG